jgi:glucosyl-dolichyl phosphate glucuronosyltransferase
MLKRDLDGAPQVAVLIATYNRATVLGETLDCIAASQPPGIPWELVVVDNNSTDDTKGVVESRQASYPAPLRYLVEQQQGRSAALNAAIATTTAPFIVFTDDDVRVDPAWLAHASRLLIEGCDYVGGPVRPIWEIPPPRWLDLTRSDTWGTIAILDYGTDAFVFEARRRVPLGCNLGVQRTVIDQVGGFRTDLGRSNGKAVLGQEVPEWLARVRAAGFHGRYAPEMVVHHHIPARRLTKQYHRRWWVGKASRGRGSTRCSRSPIRASTCDRCHTSAACRGSCSRMRCATCSRTSAHWSQGTARSASAARCGSPIFSATSGGAGCGMHPRIT